MADSVPACILFKYCREKSGEHIGHVRDHCSGVRPRLARSLALCSMTRFDADCPPGLPAHRRPLENLNRLGWNSAWNSNVNSL